MTVTPGRRSPLVPLAALTGTVCLVGLALAQQNPNVHVVKPEGNVQDADASRNSRLWVLDFRFKGPRSVKVDIPGRGQRLCWYLWYQVINNTGEPHTFIPDFELVTHDTNRVYHDQVLPKAQEAIRQLEDPTGYYQIKNSVTIAAEPIPPTRPNAVPRPVTGVAIWDDVDAESTRYSIFVSGLSNGWSLTDPIREKGQTKPVIRRKTLQLQFRRMGDRYFRGSEDVRYTGHAWIYRDSGLEVPGLPALIGTTQEKQPKEE
jgi:hypothetical protein